MNVNLINCINTLDKIWYFLTSTWLGGLIGLAIGIAIVIILSTTLFKANGISKILTTVILILTTGLGFYINSLFIDFDDVARRYKELGIELIENTTLVDPSQFITYTANGGLDKSYINLKENDPNCPTAEDKIVNMSMVEYEDIVVFYYDTVMQDQTYTVNTIFAKSDAGISFVGCFNVNVKTTGALWWKKYIFEQQMQLGNNFSNLNNITAVTGGNYDILIHYYNDTDRPDKAREIINYCDNNDINTKKTYTTPYYYTYTYQPYASVLLHEPFFEDPVIWNKNHYFGYVKDNVNAFVVAQNGCAQIYVDYFQNIGKLGIKCDTTNETTITKDMNTFYNTLYNSSSVIKSDCVVNATSYLAEVEDNVVYKGNRFVNIDYLDKTNYRAFEKRNVTKDVDLLAYFNTNKPAVTVTPVAIPNITFELYNKNASNLQNLNIAVDNVQIVLTNTETNNNYIYLFNSKTALADGITKQIPFGTYNYTIISNVLEFQGKNGTLTLDKDHTKFRLDYVFNDNHISTKINLSPISTLDLTEFDITTQPVSIKLVNVNDTNIEYDFVFNTNTLLNSEITKSVKIGTYNYTIVSEGLSFAETTGNITINANNKNLSFMYDYVNVPIEKYSLNYLGKYVNEYFPNSPYFYIILQGLDFDINLIENVSFSLIYTDSNQMIRVAYIGELQTDTVTQYRDLNGEYINEEFLVSNEINMRIFDDIYQAISLEINFINTVENKQYTVSCDFTEKVSLIYNATTYFFTVSQNENVN